MKVDRALEPKEWKKQPFAYKKKGLSAWQKQMYANDEIWVAIFRGVV